ncbi:MAG TPA: acyl-CoA dehydrogenase family protein [Myxococcota bacterium]|jgi:alkylation response protein AidB-like acyl-CoA dehydrogenase
MPTRTETQADLIERARALAPLIRAHADESERARRLATPIVEALHDAGLFRMMQPEALGGGGLNAIEAAPVLEEVACADGSAGWNLAIGAGNCAFLALLEDRAAIEALVKVPRSLGAGSINPTSLRLTPVDGGFRVSGALRFASGIHQSTWLVAGGFVIEDGKPRLAPDGLPSIVGAFFPAREARVLDSWRPTGMAGTGSHDALLEDVFVPAAHTFDFRTTGARPLDPLAALPVFSRLGATLAAVAIGIARRAREELVALAQTKTAMMSTRPLRETPRVQIDVARAYALTDAGRAQLSAVAGGIFARIAAGGAPALEDLARLRLSYLSATEHAAQAVDLMRNAAGMNAVLAGSALERCWRDVHALTQHLAVSNAHYERVGKALLGVEIGPGPL